MPKLHIHFFLLPKVWWVAREYMTLKTPAACRSSGWTGQGQYEWWPVASWLTPYRVDSFTFTKPQLEPDTMQMTSLLITCCVPGILYISLPTTRQGGPLAVLYKRVSNWGVSQDSKTWAPHYHAQVNLCRLESGGWVCQAMGPLRNLCFIFSGLFCEIGDIFVILAGVAILLSVPQRERGGFNL